MFDKDAGSDAYKDLEQKGLRELLHSTLDPIADKAMDAKEKASGRMEGLMQAIEVIKNAAFLAGRATGQAEVLEQMTKDIRNRLAAIDDKYKKAEQGEKSDGALEQVKESDQKTSRSRPGRRKTGSP